MTVSMIAAMDKGRVIGKDNRLPWHLPADFSWFKRQTMGKTVIMGLNTFKSMGERPLPKRKNIILHTDPAYRLPEGCLLAVSVDQALALSRNNGEIMVCGGQSVYQQFLSMAQRLYLTFIDGEFDGDAFFPQFPMSEWSEAFREFHPVDEKNAYACSFVILERV